MNRLVTISLSLAGLAVFGLGLVFFPPLRAALSGIVFSAGLVLGLVFLFSLAGRTTYQSLTLMMKTLIGLGLLLAAALFLLILSAQ